MAQNHTPISRCRQFLALITSVMFTSMVLFHPSLYAAEWDIQAPSVTLVGQLPEHPKGDPITFSVRVTDNKGVTGVTLHYQITKGHQRGLARIPKPNYQSKPMIKEQGSDHFSITLDSELHEATRVHYYFEANDKENNIAQVPMFENPLKIVMIEPIVPVEPIVEPIVEPSVEPSVISTATLDTSIPDTTQNPIPASQTLADTDQPSPTSSTSPMKNKWLWIGLGVVAGGVLLSSGGGGGSSGSTTDDGQIEITW